MGWILRFLEFIVIGAIGAALFVGSVYVIGVKGRALSQQICLVAVAIVLAAVTSAGVSLLITSQFPLELGPESSVFDLIDWKLVIAYGFMLIGMAAGYFNKLINDRGAKISEMKQKGIDGALPGIEFDAWDFVQPVLVSVITFGAILTKLQVIDVVNAILLGFETGFFWQTVMSKRVAPN
jgi:hypothetical protein